VQLKKSPVHKNTGITAEYSVYCSTPEKRFFGASFIEKPALVIF